MVATTLLGLSFASAQQPNEAQQPDADKPLTVRTQVEAGIPLRAYITHRVSYRLNEPVTAKIIQPVWSFDRIVIPAGTVAHGTVSTLVPVSRMSRFRAVVGGDFTPLKRAEVTFQSLTLPDGRTVEFQAVPSYGLGTYYTPPRPSKLKKGGGNQSPNRLVQAAKQQVQGQLRARSRGLYDLVRGPNKREWAEDFLLSKLPYHPQWYRTGMRIDTVVAAPVAVGTVSLARSEAAVLGSAPPPDSVVQVRMNQAVTSADARVGEPIREVLTQPLFNSAHQLVLPEGTQLMGKITLVQRARLFHRGGKLRFGIEDFQLPPESARYVASPPEPTAVRAQLAGMERSGETAVKVDAEGTARTTESKIRLIRPVIAGLVAAKSLDNDEGRQATSGSGEGNASGRALGGFSGFGLLGTLASRGPRPIGSALAFYGLAWSVYSNVVSRGAEMVFEKNTDMTIRFGASRRPK